MVPWYSYGSPFSIYTKKVQTSNVWRQNGVIMIDFTKKWPIYSEYRPKLNFWPKKVQNIKISPDFLLVKEKNDVCNIYCKIQDHTKDIKKKKKTVQ